MSFSITSPSPTHIYFDIIVSNRDSNSTMPKKLTYYEQRSNSFLANPSLYYFAIVRFSVSTPSLPLFIPTMQLATSSLTDTIYSCTLTYQGVHSEQIYVQWIPQYQGALPPQNSKVQDNSTGYYYVYSYDYWIGLVNTAFATAYGSLYTNCEALGIVLPVGSPPFMTWNTSNSTATINAPVGSEAGGFVTNLPSPYSQINIYFNSAMYQLFDSFPAIICGYGSIVNGILGGNVHMPINTYGGINTAQYPSSCLDVNTLSTYAIVNQEYSTTAIWNPVASIVFTSSCIPINPENVGTPYIYDGDTIVQFGNNSAISSIITDFEVGDGQFRPFVQYTPSSEYRLIDLTGNQPLSSIDITAFCPVHRTNVK